jgi:hypothetical protein
MENNREGNVMTKEYSSHDWRKNTDGAIVEDGDYSMKVNDSRVIFINPHTLKEETIDVSRLIRVFVNNQTQMRKSIK